MNKVLILLSLIVGFIIFFLNLGNILDVSQEEKKADIIISLGGDDNERIKKAIELYKKSYSQNNLILITGGTEFTKKEISKDSRIKYIYSLKQNINFIYNPDTKFTLSEIRYLKEYMNQNNLSKAIVVSDAYHMLRIKMLVNLVGFENKEIILVKSDLSWWNSDRYYEDIHALKLALIEVLKIPYNLIKSVIL